MSTARLLLLLLLPLAAAAEDGLGRLFHTPSERALLDASRERGAPGAVPDTAPATAPPAPPADAGEATSAPAPAPLSVDGLVLRRRGPSTAWLDGRPGTRAELAAGTSREIRIRRGEVEVGGAGEARARIKPGQVFDPALGRVVESFERPAAPATASPTP